MYKTVITVIIDNFVCARVASVACVCATGFWCNWKNEFMIVALHLTIFWYFFSLFYLSVSAQRTYMYELEMRESSTIVEMNIEATIFFYFVVGLGRIRRHGQNRLNSDSTLSFAWFVQVFDNVHSRYCLWRPQYITRTLFHYHRASEAMRCDDRRINLKLCQKPLIHYIHKYSYTQSDLFFFFFSFSSLIYNRLVLFFPP